MSDLPESPDQPPAAPLSWRVGERGRERLAALAVVRRAFAGGGIGRGRGPGRGPGRPGRRDATAERGDIDDHIRLAAREEAAASLGVAGRRLRDCMLALQACGDAPTRQRLLLRDRAVQALWEFVVQREAVGLTDHRPLEQHYGVTAELWRRMGAAPGVPLG
jgi:hypothetical protein